MSIVLKNILLSRSPYIEARSEEVSQDIGLPEIFPCGSTQAYQRAELDAKSVALLEELIKANNGKPIALSCGKSCSQCFMDLFNIAFITCSHCQ